MSHCYDDGTLRAFADGALPATEHAALAAHLAECATCQRHLHATQRDAARAHALLGASTPAVDSRAALARFQAALPNATHETVSLNQSTGSKGNRMKSQTMRRWIASAAVLVVAVALLALPPVRAAAEQLLQVFRVQNVVFLPVSEDRLAQLKDLDIDKSTLFVSEPKVTNSPAEPRTVASAGEASAASGFTVAEPSAFPSAPTSTEIVVLDRRVMETQLNVESARQVLQLMNITDVTLPDALGNEPIKADVPSSVATSYTGAGYTAQLVQGPSPEITLPDGVDMAQLGKAMLRVLGTEPAQAEAMSQQIDWSSTFVVPFPANMDGMREVTVNGSKGFLINASHEGEQTTVVYWQRDGRYYVLNATGAIDSNALLALAESVK